MISQNISPVYVNRAYQNWTANGGVYGDGGVHYQSSGTAPTLDLQFAGETAISSQVTFTRASTGTYYNSAGVLSSAAINEARLDYNPSTLAAQGLLIEEARTNSIRNNTMVGAVAGSPGTLPTNWPSTIISGSTGLTSEVVSTGTEDGITYIDLKVSGTASGAGGLTFTFEPNAQTVASQNQVWTLSMYRRLIAGSFNGLTPTATNLFVNSYSAVGSFDANATSVVRSESTPTSAALKTQRVTFTGTLSSATTARVNGGMNLTIASGAAIDITLRIGLPQLELGSFATSVIPTTTTALTRAADVASVNTLSPWYNATEGTLYAEGTLVGGAASTFPYPTALVGSNVNNDSIGVLWGANAGTMRFGVRAGGVQQADLNGTLAKSANSSYKVAGRYATNNVQAAFDGTLSTQDTSVTVPTITAMLLGGVAGFQPSANTWLRRVVYYPVPLSNAQLQAITT